jgi:hypothetical protein
VPNSVCRYTGYSCHTRFYDLGKPVPRCPKCGADQRDADESAAAVPTASRRRQSAGPDAAPEEVAEIEG